MAGFFLSPAERAFFQALNIRNVPYMVIGLSAAAIDGVRISPHDIDMWFERAGDGSVRESVGEVIGFFPNAVKGEGFERISLVSIVKGLESFADEYKGKLDRDVDGIHVKILPLDRVIENLRARGWPSDVAILPVLESAVAARKEATESKPQAS